MSKKTALPKLTHSISLRENVIKELVGVAAAGYLLCPITNLSTSPISLAFSNADGAVAVEAGTVKGTRSANAAKSRPKDVGLGVPCQTASSEETSPLLLAKDNDEIEG